MGLKKMIPKKTLERFVHLSKKINQYKDEKSTLHQKIMESFDSGLEIKEEIELYGFKVMRYPSGINTPILDRAAALRLLEKKNLKEQAIVKIEVVSEEKLKLLLQEGKLSLEEYNQLFGYNVTAKLKVEDKRHLDVASDEEDTDAVV